MTRGAVVPVYGRSYAKRTVHNSRNGGNGKQMPPVRLQASPERWRQMLYFPAPRCSRRAGWDPISMLFFVPAALCWGKRWGTKPGPMRYDSVSMA